MAGCHKCTYLSRIRVYRKINGHSFVLEASRKRPSEKKTLKPFKVMAGDVILVPCRMFDADDHDIPITVTGEFYLISTTKKSDGHNKRDIMAVDRKRSSYVTSGLRFHLVD